MIEEIKSNQQVWGKPFPLGGEWDAGVTVHRPHGRWTVRLDPHEFVVIFHDFAARTDTVLERFEPTDEGEIAAKTCAVAAMKESRRTP